MLHLSHLPAVPEYKAQAGKCLRSLPTPTSLCLAESRAAAGHRGTALAPPAAASEALGIPGPASVGLLVVKGAGRSATGTALERDWL